MNTKTEIYNTTSNGPEIGRRSNKDPRHTPLWRKMNNTYNSGYRELINAQIPLMIKKILTPPIVEDHVTRSTDK